MTKLKPCPFCGGVPEIVQIGNEATPKRGFEVRCTAWGCTTKKRAMVIRNPIEKAREFAIAAWNTRSTPQHGDDVVERLTAALRGLLRAYERAEQHGVVHLNHETMEAETRANEVLEALSAPARNGEEEVERLANLLAPHLRFVVGPNPDTDTQARAQDNARDVARKVLASLPLASNGRDDWRCVNCKRVVSSATEPEQCLKCRCRTFAHIVPLKHQPGNGGERERGFREGVEAARVVTEEVMVSHGDNDPRIIGVLGIAGTRIGALTPPSGSVS